ncbi:MAG: Flp pilus assembly protein CpaB [Acidimicrobiia bacterium]
MSRRVLIVIVAVALAGVSAFAAVNYLSSADSRALGNAEMVEVFVVKKDITKGFPGEQALDEGYVVKDRIPRKYYPAKAVVNSQTLRGKVALAPIPAGLPVVDGAFVDPRVATVSFAQRIDQGMEAISISVSDTQGVARLVVPGDHVNMILTLPEDPANEVTKKSQFVLKNIEVLAVGNAVQLQPGEEAAQPAVDGETAPVAQSGLLTLSLPALDTQKVTLAQEIGSIHLTLVPPDFAPAPVPPVNRGNIFS